MSSSLSLLFFLLTTLISLVIPHSLLKIFPETPISDDRNIQQEDILYCSSWSFTVETNDAGYWPQIPKRCVAYVENYMNGDRYVSDSDMVSNNSFAFAETVEIVGDGKDVWVFDIDETLLTNLPYYAIYGFGVEIFNETAFNEWVALAECPALPASLKLYKELQQLGFKIILLTGRDESQRNATTKNLLAAGYHDWDRLFLRGPSDVGKTAVVYKSEKRMQLEAEGCRIHGNSGDQWSDLMGSPMARRSFKLPNPMYYIA